MIGHSLEKFVSHFPGTSIGKYLVPPDRGCVREEKGQFHEIHLH